MNTSTYRGEKRNKKFLFLSLAMFLVDIAMTAPQIETIDGWTTSFDIGLEERINPFGYPYYFSIDLDDIYYWDEYLDGPFSTNKEVRGQFLHQKYFEDYDNVEICEQLIDGKNGLVLHGTDDVLEEGYVIELWIDENSEFWRPRIVLVQAFAPAHVYARQLIDTIHVEPPLRGILNTTAEKNQNVTLGSFQVNFILNAEPIGYTIENGTGYTHSTTSREFSRFGTSVSSDPVAYHSYILKTEQKPPNSHNLEITIFDYDDRVTFYRDYWEGQLTHHDSSKPISEIKIDGQDALLADLSYSYRPNFIAEYWLDGSNIRSCLADKYTAANGSKLVRISSDYPLAEITQPLLESFHVGMP